jgi:hypothetical protein
LGQFTRFPKLVKRHLIHEAAMLGRTGRFRFGGHPGAQLLEIPGHVQSSPSRSSLEVAFEQPVSHRHVRFIATVVAGFVASVQENRCAARATARLSAEFAHLKESGMS